MGQRLSLLRKRTSKFHKHFEINPHNFKGKRKKEIPIEKSFNQTAVKQRLKEKYRERNIYAKLHSTPSFIFHLRGAILEADPC